MSRKLLAITIAMVFVLALLVSIPFGTAVAADEAVTSLAGSGTEEDPYLIGTKAEFIFFRDNYAGEAYYGKNFKLTADIVWSDFDGSAENRPGDNWTSVATEEVPFEGVFDGDGFGFYGIHNVGTGRTDTNGIFAAVGNATIKNLIVDKSYFEGYRPVAFVHIVSKAGADVVIRNCANFATLDNTGNDGGYAAGMLCVSGPGSAQESWANSIVLDRCVNFGDVISKGANNGGIAGLMNRVENITIKMCANYGAITGKNVTGGIVATIGAAKATFENIVISDCYNGGSVTTVDASNANGGGGIAGRFARGTIRNCVNVGDITTPNTTSKNNVGAITGDAGSGVYFGDENDVVVVNCYYLEGCLKAGTFTNDNRKDASGNYFTTAISAEDLIAGFENIPNPDNSKENALGFDSMIWTTDTADGYPAIKTITIVDLWESPITYYTYVFLTADYELLDTGVLAEGSVIPAPEAPVIPTTLAWVYNFTGWSGYTDGMAIYDNVVFQATYEQVANPENPYNVEGDGTAEAPYLVGSAGALEYVVAAMTGATELVAYTGELVPVTPAVNGMDSCITLTADINWGEYKTDETHNWEPIGNKNNAFTGVFDGQGHTISGLRVYEEKTDSQGEGLFAAAGNGAVIKNTIIKDSTIASGDYTAAFVGQAVQGGTLTIDNCASYATIHLLATNGTRAGAIVAGAAGSSSDATITNCVNYGTILSNRTDTGAAYIGGIIGNLGNKLPLKVDSCANFGDIVLSDNHCIVAGIVGQCSTKDGIEGISITNCYNAGEIGAGRMAAGICGRLYTGATMENCYNVGKVTINGQIYATLTADGAADPAKEAKYASQIDNFVGDLEWGTTATNSYHLAGLAACVSDVHPHVADGGVAALEGAYMIPIRHTGKVLTEAEMTGASAVANMKFDADVWQATTGYPTLKGITIVEQYNGEYQNVEAGGATTTTTEPDVTTTEPDVTTTEPDVTTTEPDVTTTEPDVTTTVPATETTGPEVTTTPSESGSNAVIWIVIAVVAVVVVAGVVVFFVIKKK